MAKDKDPESPDYSVGYGRPPEGTRFIPGKSGNPRGRPRGSRTVGAVLQEVLQQKITITENGKTRRVPAIEAMARRLRSDALRGEGGSMRLLLSLTDRYADSTETAVTLDDLGAEDQAILAKYMPAPANDEQSSDGDAASDSRSGGEHEGDA